MMDGLMALGKPLHDEVAGLAALAGLGDATGCGCGELVAK